MLFFTTFGLAGGRGLWRSDGTEAGTFRIFDQYTHSLTDASGKMFFVSNGPVNPEQLWTTDGVTVTLLTATPETGYFANAAELVNVNGTLFLYGYTGLGIAIYSSDGTVEGTKLVKQFGDLVYPGGLTAVGDTLFFALLNVNTKELWKSDGTESGTVRVAANVTIDFLGAVGNELFFSGNDVVHGPELWRSDGTEAGTYMIVDSIPGRPGIEPGGITDVNGVAYFAGGNSIDTANSVYGRELWRSDGTAAGTYMVADIAPGVASSYASTDALLPISPTSFLFMATTEALGYELWRCDTDSANPKDGVQLVRDADVTTDSSAPRSYAVANGGRMYFAARDFYGVYKLWVSRGINDIQLVSGAYTDADQLTVVNDTLYFAALADDPDARGLWKVDSSGVATRVISNPVGFLARCGNALYFTEALVGTQDTQFGISKIDGTTGIATMLASILPRPGALPPLAYTQVGDKVFFVVRDVAQGEEPWVTDGTPQGTHIVKDINPGAGDSLNNFTVFRGLYYMSATDGVNGRELWRSDGTEQGTVRLTDLRPGSTSGVSSLLLRATDDAIYFSGTDPNSPGKWTVWKTDGTPEHTAPLATTTGGLTPQPGPGPTAVAGNKVYFVATTRATGQELWVADEHGTHLVKDIFPGPATSNVDHLAAAQNGILYFRAIDPTYGSQLWSTDGTEAGTKRMTDIDIPNGGGAADAVTAIGSRVFFDPEDSVHGSEPWYIDLGPVIRIPRPQNAEVADTSKQSGKKSVAQSFSAADEDILLELASR